MMAHSARQWEPLRAQQMAPRMYWPQLAHVPPRQQPQLAAAAPVGRGSRTVRTCFHLSLCSTRASAFRVSALLGATYHRAPSL
jgi:hypothetical protein